MLKIVKITHMNPTKKRILVVADKNDQLYELISSILGKEFIVEELFGLSNTNISQFFLANWFKNWRKILKVFKKFKPDKILICSDSLTSVWVIVLLVRLFRLKIEIIVFRVDIENFRPYEDFHGLKNKLEHFLGRRFEKLCLLKVDKIIHKGLKNELEFLSFYDKIKNKPHHLFREFLHPYVQRSHNPNVKLSKRDNQFHLVSVGSLPLKGFVHSDSIWEFYPRITNQKMHLHIYAKADKTTEEEFKKIQSKNEFFHYEGYINHEQLIKELSKYDYGVYLTPWNRAKINNNYFLITMFGNRIFDYLSAYLPVIGTKDCIAVSEMIDKYKIGINIDYDEIDSLKKILTKNKKKYPQITKNIAKVIPQFLDCTDFIKFVSS